jgi:hypothetical protein
LNNVGSNGTKTCREAEVIAQEQSLGDLKESLQEEDLGKQEDGGSLGTFFDFGADPQAHDEKSRLNFPAQTIIRGNENCLPLNFGSNWTKTNQDSRG